MAEYEPWNDDRARAIIAGFVGVEGASLPILHALQATFGCVPRDAEPLVAAALNLSRAEVHGIVSFYHEFRRTAPGRHLLQVCRAEACQAVGGDGFVRFAGRHCSFVFVPRTACMCWYAAASVSMDSAANYNLLARPWSQLGPVHYSSPLSN